MRHARWLVPLGVSAAALGACRGQESAESPVIFHLVPHMEFQPRYKPEGESAFFEDGRAMRPPVEGTVARGELPRGTPLETGRDGEGYVQVAPVTLDRALLARGRERFDIHCTPCHDATGRGRGMAVQRGYPSPPDLTDARVSALPDGELFNVITHGIRNMPAYATQLGVEDRWAIVAWVRVLEQARNSREEDVPVAARAQLKQGGRKP
ncbi:cytochrome c [Myxococcus faecalis]|uniref:c-type cytochrome n=1 Tax=Myxococcus faecalis TaxID=3115646 RepID=UPI003CEDFE22